MAGDVATAGTAGTDVTQVPEADDRVASGAVMPSAPETPDDQQPPRPARTRKSRDSRSKSAPPAARAQADGTDSAGSELAGSELAGSDLAGSDMTSPDLADSDLTGSETSGSETTGSETTGSETTGSDAAVDANGHIRPAEQLSQPSGEEAEPAPEQPDDTVTSGKTRGDRKGTPRSASRPARRSPSASASAAAGQAAADVSAGAAAVRRRLARLGTARGGGINPVLEPLVKTVRTTHPKADIRQIERAYDTAARMHAGQSRRSGDPYITHPLAVATILAELGMNHETICAALLHDTIEDTPYSLAELRSEFGDEIAELVDGVTKLDKVKYGDAAQAETVRKMVVAMSRDIRVLVIKLADRLHNMRTLRYLPRPKQEQKSREVL